MYLKQLYRTALISLPILAFFELSPIFMLTQISNVYQSIIVAFCTSIVGIALIWAVNILIILFFESRNGRKKWQQYLISYVFTVLMVGLILFCSFVNIYHGNILTIIFDFINAIALNSAILILSNAIIFRSKKIQADNELTSLKIKSLEAEQQQLIEQLQPHFLFNALSTLKSLIKTDSELAEEYLVNLSNFLRFTVSSHQNKIVVFAEELRFTRDYIELQHIRFADSFSCEIDIPEEAINQYSVPIYALQTLIENAIKHNAFSEENPLIVNVVLVENSLIVSNNKIPKPVALKGGVGLDNLNKRYLLICGEEVKVEETPDRFTVRIKLIQKDQLC